MLLHDVIYVLLLIKYVYSVIACMILLYAVNSPVIGYLTGKLQVSYVFLSGFLLLVGLNSVDWTGHVRSI